MTEIRSNIRHDSKLIHLSPEAKESLRLMLNRLDNGKPRELPCSHEQRPVLVFTDGASDGDLNTIGGLLFSDGHFRYFSCHVPPSLVTTWKASSQTCHSDGRTVCSSSSPVRLEPFSQWT